MIKIAIGIFLGVFFLYLIGLFLYNRKLNLRFMKNNELPVSKVDFLVPESTLER